MTRCDRTAAVSVAGRDVVSDMASSWGDRRRNCVRRILCTVDTVAVRTRQGTCRGRGAMSSGAAPSGGGRVLWDAATPPARGPRRGLSLDEIGAAAVAVADRDGLEGLSMQRVSAEVGLTKMGALPLRRGQGGARGGDGRRGRRGAPAARRAHGHVARAGRGVRPPDRPRLDRAPVAAVGDDRGAADGPAGGRVGRGRRADLRAPGAVGRTSGWTPSRCCSRTCASPTRPRPPARAPGPPTPRAARRCATWSVEHAERFPALRAVMAGGAPGRAVAARGTRSGCGACSTASRPPPPPGRPVTHARGAAPLPRGPRRRVRRGRPRLLHPRRRRRLAVVRDAARGALLPGALRRLGALEHDACAGCTWTPRSPARSRSRSTTTGHSATAPPHPSTSWTS